MFKKIEVYVTEIIRNKKKGVIPSVIKAFLLPISWMHHLVVILRNWLYDRGWMRRYIPPVPLVISIGNIVAGGTGKTPFTLMLAESFYPKYSLAILSRGYRSKIKKQQDPLILCEGTGPLFPAIYSGDEPYIFASRLPKSHVIVGGNRYAASHIAAAAGVDVILLDDALQHRRLARDFDIVLVDVNDPFGYNHFIPRGFLRDEKNSLKRASLIVLNHVQDQIQYEIARKNISQYTTAPIIATAPAVKQICNFRNESIEIPPGTSVGMFCGIAQPDNFKKTIQNLDLNLVSEYHLADHDIPNLKVLHKFIASSKEKGAVYILCTEKDYVKIDKTIPYELPILWLKMELKIVAGEEIWNEFINNAFDKIY